MGDRCESTNYRSEKSGKNLCEVILTDKHDETALNHFVPFEQFLLEVGSTL